MINYAQIITQELSGLYGQTVLKEMNEVIKLYDFYEGKGQVWDIAEKLDYIPSKITTNYTKKLIKDEARFMFGRMPEFKFKALLQTEDKEKKQALDKVLSQLEDQINKILSDNHFQEKLIKGARDCFIGKRVAIKLWGSKDEGIKVMFKPSLEFIFETDPDDIDQLSKIVFFHLINDKSDKGEQRIWKQKWEMVRDRCILNEAIYDGMGKVVEEIWKDHDTGLDFIPCRVIINDGLTGDLTGESDVAELMDDQTSYNRLKSDDVDALKFNMFPQRVAKDADEKSLKNMKIAPGALVDLQTDPTADDRQADMKMLEATFSYDQRFENAINRIKNDMHDLLSVPNVSLEQLKGLMQSGKSMKALYWGLLSRCEEKWATWEPALRWMIEAIIKMAKVYRIKDIPEVEYKLVIEHLYPILEDEDNERMLDMQEVNTQVRSRRNYIDKWNVNEDSEAEMQKVVEEQGMLQEQFMKNIEDDLDG